MAGALDPRRRGQVPAAVTAAGVFAVALAQDAVLAIVSLVGSISYAGQGLTYVGTIISQSATDTVVTSLPLAVGVFLSLWQFAPIDGSLRLAHVIARSLLAAGIGGLAAFVVAGLVNTGRTLVGGLEFAYTGGLGGGPFGDLLGAAFLALQSAAVTLVDTAAVVVLGGVLLWLWATHADRAHRVEGMPES